MAVPPLLVDVGTVAAAVAALWAGASWFVEGASTTARRLGIPGLVVGLTVVSLGTSAPEFAVTLDAALAGRADISVANVVGSNVLNLGFVIGGAALVRALPTSRSLLRRDGTVLVGATLLTFVLVLDLRVSRLEGGLLAALMVAYLLVLARSGREDPAGADAPGGESEPASPGGSGGATPVPVDGPLASDANPATGGVGPGGAGTDGTPGGDPGETDPDGTAGDDARGAVRAADVLRFVVGLALVVVGAHLLVLGASDIAREAGVSEWVIGATVVAGGTSTPEFVTSVVAARQGRAGISGGNVVGSCIFNLLGVLGLAALVSPLSVAAAAIDGMWWLLGTVVVVSAMLGTRRVLSRTEGGVLVAINAVNWIVDFLL